MKKKLTFLMKLQFVHLNTNLYYLFSKIGANKKF